jgi:hypothetical protein
MLEMEVPYKPAAPRPTWVASFGWLTGWMRSTGGRWAPPLPTARVSPGRARPAGDAAEPRCGTDLASEPGWYQRGSHGGDLRRQEGC